MDRCASASKNLSRLKAETRWTKMLRLQQCWYGVGKAKLCAPQYLYSCPEIGAPHIWKASACKR